MSSQQSAPYRPDTQLLGGTPTKTVDIPVCAVFIALYIVAAVIHQSTLIRNKKRGKKFGFNGMMFGLCMIRLVTCSLRIAWACYARNIRLGIAAQIFTNIGVVLLYLVNLFFAQRIVRAQHPRFGWSMIFNPLVPICCVVTVLTIVALVVAVIQSFYTTGRNIHRIDRTIEIYGATAFAVLAFVPILVILISTLTRQIPGFQPNKAMDKFGSGKMRTKIVIVLASASLLTLAASVKAGTAYNLPVPLTVPGSDPVAAEPAPWYYNRGIFYGFGFGCEILVLYFYALVRVDKRFIIPDGAKGPYSYAGGFVFAGESGNEKPTLSTRHLTDSSQSLQSWGGSSKRRSRSATRSVVSWGGITDYEAGVGEDGVQRVPYPPDLEDRDGLKPVSMAGAEQEMGWDARSGKWRLRPVSTYSGVSSAATAVPSEQV